MVSALPFLTLSYPSFDPVALKLGPFGPAGEIWIRWYGLAYVAGLLLGWIYIRRLVSSPKLWSGPAPLTLDQVDMLLLWVMAGVVLGGRLGVMLYDPRPYLNDPWEIFRTWRGGMAFHGGLIGVIIAITLFARRHSLRPLGIGDLVATVVPVGLFFGRIANFVNGELWGRVSDAPWAMVFPDRDAGPLPRHPSQLYEAGLEGLALGLVLWWLVTRGWLKHEGFSTGAFLAGYGVARSLCELFREGDTIWLFPSAPMPAGMIYSLPMVAVGAWMMWRAGRVEKAGQVQL